MAPPSDPRVGSARDNSTSPGLSRVISGSNSSSISNLLGTLIPVLVFSSVCVIAFIILRRKYPRVYAPRSFLNSLEPQYVPSSGPACSVPTTDIVKARKVRRFQRDGLTGFENSIASLPSSSSTTPLLMDISSFASFAWWVSYAWSG
jgi:hypothetical protein